MCLLQIRKQAIKDLPVLCKDNKEHTARIADILAQLLQAEDSSELSVVHNSIMSLMKNDPKGMLKAVNAYKKFGIYMMIHDIKTTLYLQVL